MTEGKALDLIHTCSLRGASVRILGGENYALLEGASVVPIAAGRPRTPGRSREDLMGANLDVIQQVVEKLRWHAPNAVYLMVTNPLDAMTHAAWKLSGKPAGKVLGMAGGLESARMRGISLCILLFRRVISICRCWEAMETLWFRW